MTARQEVPLYTVGEVDVSRVTWHHPLPPNSAPHPPECDSLSYLRYRLVGSGEPDAVLSLQPGYTGGASSFDTIARNLVLDLAAKETTAEVWAMERRSHGLHDATGMAAAVAAKDYRVALDYYYRGREVAGRTFSGWTPPTAQRFLTEVGIAQTILDWHFVHTHELPDRSIRASKLFIGGHSLGGPLSSFYCQWDFPNGPGYTQVAGVVGLDGPIGADPFGMRQRPILGPVVRFAGRTSRPIMLRLLRTGIVNPTQNGRRVRLGDVSLAVAIAGIATRFEPTSESELPAALPQARLLDIALRALFPRGHGPFRQWRLTNEAAFGSLFARCSQPSTLANDMGTYDGPVVRKRPSVARFTRLPLVGDLIGGLVTSAALTMPANPLGRLTGWDRCSSICDIDDAALAWGNGEFSYMNTFDTLRIGLDLFYATLGIDTGELAPLRHGDFEDKVAMAVIIGDIWRPLQKRGLGQPATAIYAEGYSHQDILGAARHAAGTADIVTSTVVTFIGAALAQHQAIVEAPR